MGGKKKAGAVSQYELGRLEVIKSTCLETSASKGCFFPLAVGILAGPDAVHCIDRAK